MLRLNGIWHQTAQAAVPTSNPYLSNRVLLGQNVKVGGAIYTLPDCDSLFRSDADQWRNDYWYGTFPHCGCWSWPPRTRHLPRGNQTGGSLRYTDHPARALSGLLSL